MPVRVVDLSAFRDAVEVDVGGDLGPDVAEPHRTFEKTLDGCPQAGFNSSPEFLGITVAKDSLLVVSPTRQQGAILVDNGDAAHGKPRDGGGNEMLYGLDLAAFQGAGAASSDHDGGGRFLNVPAEELAAR